MLLWRFFERLFRRGNLSVIDVGGRQHHFGDGTGPAIALHLYDKALYWKLFVRPELYFGEAFVDGTLAIANGCLYDFLDLLGRNLDQTGGPTLDRFASVADRLLRRVYQFNPLGRARRNAAHHYDLSVALYDLFLDCDRQYSCGYFLKPESDDIDRAQAQKRQHIAAKLLLAPGHRLLDVGCGWGGLCLYLADHFDVEATGITLSEEQLRIAESRAAEAGLASRVRFALRDYRQESGQYDRIVSVGMFEHVGINHYREFFAMIRDSLADDGIALLHTIGRSDLPGGTNPWMRKYIFPGGYIPALSELAAAIEDSGLWVIDVEVWRLHYAETLRRWRERFLANRSQAVTLYDERFCRMWEFYLACTEMGFRYRHQCVFQVQLAKRIDAAPIVRDYMVDGERALAVAEAPRQNVAA